MKKERQQVVEEDSTETCDDASRPPGRVVYLIQQITGPWTWRNLLSWVLLIGAILSIKGFIIDQYTIPSDSMAPVLKGGNFFTGDRVLVNKWVYGPRIPFTAHRLWKWGEPERWDIVVFYSIEENAAHPVLVKRVVGLPGEKVLIREGKIHINGKVVEPPEELRDILHYTTEFLFSRQDTLRTFLNLAKRNQPLEELNPGNDTVQQLYADMAAWHPKISGRDIGAMSDEELETLCEGVSSISLNIIPKLFRLKQDNMCYGVVDEPQYTQIPEGHYFLLGDNSGRSADARLWGWLPQDHLLGHAFAIWWPWNRRHDFTGFSKTWWGLALLYGIPAALMLLEAGLLIRERRRKKAGF